MKASKHILRGQHYPDTKTRQRHQEKETYRPVFQMNIDVKTLKKKKKQTTFSNTIKGLIPEFLRNKGG